MIKIKNICRKSYFFIRRYIPIKLIFSFKKLIGINRDPWSHSKNNKYDALFEKYRSSLPVNKVLENKICVYIANESRYLKDFIEAKKDLHGILDIKDPLSHDYFSKDLIKEYDGFMFAISHGTNVLRAAFNEKMAIFYDLNSVVWPNKNESYIYEGKRRSAYYFQTHKISHPKTFIFYRKKDAESFVEKSKFPLILKTDQGAGASGVVFVKNIKQAKSLIDIFFNGSFYRWGADFRDKEWGSIIFQEFISNAREYRVIKIGDYWFGHEKKRKNSGLFHSGSGVNSWDVPELRVFDFCRQLAEKHDFHIMSMDIFEDESGNLLVNELQTWFGSYNPSQMYLNGVPGAYLYENANWVFKEGLFNINGGANLRILEFDKYITRIKQGG